MKRILKTFDALMVELGCVFEHILEIADIPHVPIRDIAIEQRPRFEHGSYSRDAGPVPRR